ncbi:MAG: L-seryl-tRNA(Sec) selenium transferase [Clostridia bacterium]|nr:L-seryl-tRNA(Sec) selenium transferase [Clostridia bacterium]
MDKHQLLRDLPSVDQVLEKILRKEDGKKIPHEILVEKVREVIAELRRGIQEGRIKTAEKLDPAWVGEKAYHRTKAYLSPNLRPVINATGVVLHTNLGRAVLSQAARESLLTISRGYCNLEIDLDTGNRGSRYSHVVELICRLTGAEDALVVNNNAAAVLLALNTLACGKEVIVSRGQLVEIGGSFRVPEVMQASGAKLVEVGTTNKTYLEDYRRAIGEETALLLKVHPSIYRVMGFTHDTSLEEMVALGREKGLPVMEDLGSGFLIDLRTFGITGEPTVQEQLSAGADVVTFSGDKLLGGPQGGIIVGKKEFIARMAKNPLTRAFRVDKLTMAALEATLRSYLDKDQAIKEIPTLAMLVQPREEIERKARHLAQRLESILESRARVSIIPGMSQAGGGALPILELPTFLVALEPLSGRGVEEIARLLRQGEPSVMGRIAEERLLFDLRTVAEGEIEVLVQAIEKTFAQFN